MKKKTTPSRGKRKRQKLTRNANRLAGNGGRDQRRKPAIARLQKKDGTTKYESATKEFRVAKPKAHTKPKKERHNMPKETDKTPEAGDEKKPLEQLTAQIRNTEPGKKETLLRFALAVAQGDQAAYLTAAQVLDKAEELAAEYEKRAAKIKG